METDTPGRTSSIGLVPFLWARRRFILGITLLGMLGGAAASYMIRPLYKSEAVLFPAATNSLSKAVLGETGYDRADILGLGDEQDAEKLLQILHSDAIRWRVADRHDLFTVYRIAADDKHREAHLAEVYKERFTFEYTRFGSVRVTVLDEVPERAALMANTVVALVDTVWRGMAHERAAKSMRVVREKLEELDHSLRQIEDSMRTLRRMGVHNYQTQAERLHEYLGNAIVKGDQRAVQEIERRLQSLAELAGPYTALADRYQYELGWRTSLRKRLDQTGADLDNDLPFAFVVDQARAADKKSYPIRWLVVAISAAAALLLATLLIALGENIRHIRGTP